MVVTAVLTASGGDAGVRSDAGVGLRADAGADAGRRDAGVDAGIDAGVDAGRVVAVWQAFDGVTRFDGGLTDLVELSPDASVELQFPQHVLDLVCDDLEVVRIDILAASFSFTGLTPGLTHCGFWFQRGMPPGRYVEVQVVEP